MKIQIGDYDVYDNGSIISIPNEPIRFFIENLVFEIYFIDDTNTEEQKIDVEQLENKKGLKLIFKNFNNSFGTGNISPIPLGFIGKKTIYFNYRVHALNGDDKEKRSVGKTLHYTWLLKDKED